MRGLAPLDALLAIGHDHTSASGTARGLLLRDRDGLDELLETAVREGRLGGAVVLATCLRFEVVLNAPEKSLLPVIAGWMHARAQICAPTVRSGTGAASHLLRVAGSLESLVPGEREVARQVRRAFETARGLGRVDRTLNALDRHATNTARRIHDEVFTNARARGFAAETIERIRTLAPRRVLVLGQGELGTAVAHGIADDGELVLASRHPKRIDGLPEARPLAETLESAFAFDVVVVATAASNPVLLAGHVAGGSPIVIDLGTPPQVSRDVEALTTVLRLESFAHAVDDDSLTRAERIVASELAALQDRLQLTSAASKASTARDNNASVWAVERNETSKPLGAR